MAIKGKIFMLSLLIHVQVVNSQLIPEEFSHTDEQINHLREKRDVNTDVEYIVVIDVNGSEVTLFDQIESSVESISPLQIDNTTTINGFDITAVCQPNESEYQCTCEDQYVWSYNNCITYNACDNLEEGTCTCISAIPSDGQVCVAKNATTEPTTINTTPPFTSTPNAKTAATTTNTTTTNTTPQPTAYATGAATSTNTNTTLTNATLPLTSTITTAAITTDKSTTTTRTTPPTTSIVNTTIGEITNKRAPITTSTATTTTATATVNTSTVTMTTSPATTTTANSPATAKKIHLLSFSLKINKTFDLALIDKKSNATKDYTTKLENLIDSSYRSVPDYQASSAKVTGFSPGSVNVAFNISATSDNLDLSLANRQLANMLSSEGLNMFDNSIQQKVEGELYSVHGDIHAGTNLILTCKPPVNDNINWTWNEKSLSSSDKYVINNTELTVINASASDNGEYACRTTVNALPYVIWQIIKIQPYPNIQVTSQKTVQCNSTPTINLQCCVQDIYQVEWYNATACNSIPTASCIYCNYITDKDCQTETVKEVTCRFKGSNYISKIIKINLRTNEFLCSNNEYGAGNKDDIQTTNCTGEMVGYKVAQCNSSHHWSTTEDHCVLRVIQNFKDEAENLQAVDIPEFMANLSNTVTLKNESIIHSSATITTIVEILTIISDLSQNIFITRNIMEDFLTTVEVIGSNSTLGTWQDLNNKKNTTMKYSNLLLKSTENIADRLPDESIMITTNFTSLSKSFITAPFNGTFGKNLTTNIYIPGTSAQMPLTVIISSSFNNILPVRNLNYNHSTIFINTDVAVIQTKKNVQINNIFLTFNVKNKTLGNPQCVFWNFSLLNGVGEWDTTGCQLKTLGNQSDKYTCECNHTTSFSILMSPYSPNKATPNISDYITYIGIAISLASLVLCLLIEIIIWKVVTRNDTSYMRHVSIVNIAVSLLIADICFIIGAAVVKEKEEKSPKGPCSTATFFMHFFYLALFFWMLLSALFLLYRIFMVFSRMTRGAMMAIAFTVGYGAPLLIAAITVASTAGNHGYIQTDHNCWLNWSETKALLAFVIPALTIVVINLLVLIVVLCKMLRRGVNASTQPDEKHPLLVIVKCVAILTPLFGLTWGFGIGTMVSPNSEIETVFAFFNSLQGFFILLFGVLLDSRVREALAGTFSLRNLRSNRTRSTSAGPSSSSGVPFIWRFWQRNVYNVSNNGIMSSSSSNLTADTDNEAYTHVLLESV